MRLIGAFALLLALGLFQEAYAACTLANPPMAPGSRATRLDTQTSDRVKITGGCIDAAGIGQNFPGAGNFTTLDSTSGPRDLAAFGAVCDGTTDDAAAFTAAVAWLSGGRNREVRLPAATCATSLTVTIGDGRQQSTTLGAAASGTSITVASCTGIEVGDAVAIKRDDGTTFTGVTASSCSSGTLVISGAYSGGTASSGNAVYTGKISSYNGVGFVGYGSGATTAEWPSGASVSTIKYIGSTATTTTLGGTASASDVSLTVASISNISLGTPVGVTLNNGRIWWTWATESPSGTTVKIANEIPSTATSGNAVLIGNNPVVKIAGPIVNPKFEGIQLDANSLAAVGLDVQHSFGGNYKALGGVRSKGYLGVGNYIHSGEFYAATATGTVDNDFQFSAIQPNNNKTIGCWYRGTAAQNVAFSRNRFHGGMCTMGGNDVTAAAIREEWADNNLFFKAYTAVNGASTSGAGLYRQPSINKATGLGENYFSGPSLIGGVTEGTATGGGLYYNYYSGYAVSDGETIPSGSKEIGVTTTNVRFPAPATYSNIPANPTGTTSTAAFVMMGLAGAITPATSGKVLISISGNVSNSTATDGAFIRIKYGTGSAPTNGAATTGTNCTSTVRADSDGASSRMPFGLTCVATGLTVGTAYWIDMDVEAITGGTASLANITISAAEL